MAHNVLVNTNANNLLHHCPHRLDYVLETYKRVHGLNVMPPAVQMVEVTADRETEIDLYNQQMTQNTNAQNHPTNQELGKLYSILMDVLFEPYENFLRQIDLNEKALAINQVTTEVIEGRATEATAMLVDEEVPADRQQLNDLITNKVKAANKPLENQIKEQQKMIQQLIDATQKQLTTSTDGNFNRRGPARPGASGKKKSGQNSNTKQKSSNGGNSNRNRNNRRGRSRSRSRGRSRRGSSRGSSAGSRADDSSKDTRGDRPKGRRRSASSNRRSNRSSRRSNTRNNRS